MSRKRRSNFEEDYVKAIKKIMREKIGFNLLKLQRTRKNIHARIKIEIN